VVIPAFDARATIVDAVKSALDQRDVEVRVLVGDDGSSDGTAEIVEALGESRVEVLRGEHSGIPVVLNRLLERVETPLVARQDADDRSHPDRLAQQVRFLHAHENIDVVGSAFRYLGGPPAASFPYTESPTLARWQTFFWCPLSIATVTARTSALAIGFDPDFDVAEDYEFYCRNRSRLAFASLPEPLVEVRRHADSTTARRPERVRELTLRALEALLERTLSRPVNPEVAAALYYPDEVGDANVYGRAIELILELEALELTANDLEEKTREEIQNDATERIRRLLGRGTLSSPRDVLPHFPAWIRRNPGRAIGELAAMGARRVRELAAEWVARRGTV